MNWRVRAIVDFVRSDPVFYSAYLLHTEGQDGATVDTPESCYAFLLWFIAHGRAHYQAPLVIPDEVRSAIAVPDRSLCHPLMSYIADQAGRELRGEELRAWYYREAVPRYGLAAFLSRAELVALSPRGHRPGKGADLDRLSRRFRPGEPPVPGGDSFPEILSRLASGAEAEPHLPSVSIVGLHRSVLGVGEDARCLFECLTEAGISCELVDVSPVGFAVDDRSDRYRPFEAPRPTAPVLVFCLPAFEMMRAIASRAMLRPVGAQYRIGYWPWETTALPETWHHVFDFVDEVWASSTFLSDTYSAATAKPVVRVPLHVRVEAPSLPRDLEALFDGSFTVLSIFDFNSGIERKNPLGTIAAFRKAFPREAGRVQLLLKTINGDMQAEDFARVQGAIEGDDRVAIVDGPLPRAELCGLISMADAYLSLHRSEGFGRPLAEAMLLGTSVIATQWSGSADFLTEATGHPVRSNLRPVRKGEYPFVAGLWAEPDVGHAAELLRRVYERRDTAAKTQAARDFVEGTFGRTAIAELLRTHFSGRFAAASPPAG